MQGTHQIDTSTSYSFEHTEPISVTASGETLNDCYVSDSVKIKLLDVLSSPGASEKAMNSVSEQSPENKGLEKFSDQPCVNTENGEESTSFEVDQIIEETMKEYPHKQLTSETVQVTDRDCIMDYDNYEVN